MAIHTAALLLAGSFFLAGWNFGRVKEDVVIGGVEVGGMTYREAEERVRALDPAPPLYIFTPEGRVYVGEELTVRDDIARLVRRAKRGERLEVSYQREWADAENTLLSLAEKFVREPKDAQLLFGKEGFTYIPEENGLCCDLTGALSEACRALASGGTEINLSFREYPPAVTEGSLRARTQKLSEYATYFDASNAPRKHNIALAVSRIAGTVLPPKGEFSFNAAVGQRTEENGFLPAPVIFRGEFVTGVGGGVCQASTTLFNAALRAGMLVTESRAHSLSVGYAPPSLDAMVSEESDLKFVNPFDFPVYLLGSVKGGQIGFSLYGMPDGRRYETESVVLFRTPPPEAEVVEGEEDKVLRAEKEGLVSESYLSVYSPEGKLLSRTRIRRDRYAPVRGKREIKIPPAGDILPSEGDPVPPAGDILPPEGGANPEKEGAFLPEGQKSASKTPKNG